MKATSGKSDLSVAHSTAQIKSSGTPRIRLSSPARTRVIPSAQVILPPSCSSAFPLFFTGSRREPKIASPGRERIDSYLDGRNRVLRHGIPPCRFAEPKNCPLRSPLCHRGFRIPIIHSEREHYAACVKRTGDG